MQFFFIFSKFLSSKDFYVANHSDTGVKMAVVIF